MDTSHWRTRFLPVAPTAPVTVLSNDPENDPKGHEGVQFLDPAVPVEGRVRLRCAKPGCRGHQHGVVMRQQRLATLFASAAQAGVDSIKLPPG